MASWEPLEKIVMSIYLQYKAIDLEKKYNPVTYWHKHDSF